MPSVESSTVESTSGTASTVRIAWRRDSSDPYNEAVHFAVASAWIAHVKGGKVFPIQYNSRYMTTAAIISDIKKTIIDTRKRVIAVSDKTDEQLITDELARLKAGRHEARRKHVCSPFFMSRHEADKVLSF